MVVGPITTKGLYWLGREYLPMLALLYRLTFSLRYLIIAIAFYVHPDAVDVRLV